MRVSASSLRQIPTVECGFQPLPQKMSGVLVNKTKGFYVDTSKSNELNVNLDVTKLKLNATGNLGIFQAKATDQGTSAKFNFIIDIKDSSNTDNQLTLPELQNIGSRFQNLVDINLDGAVNVKLKLDTGFSNPKANFLSLKSDFSVDWTFGNSKIDPVNPYNLGGVPKIAFTNVKLDLSELIGNLVSPVLKEIQNVTDPIKPILDILTKPLPVLSTFSPKEITLLDIAQIVDPKANLGFLKAWAGITNLVKSIPTDKSALLIDLGSFDLGSLDVRSSSFDIKTSSLNITKKVGNISQQLEKNTNSSAASIAKFVAQMKSSESSVGKLNFKLLDDPTTAFNLLLGQQADLFSYKMPSLNINGHYTQFIPILGPLGAEIVGNVGASINFEFGYDTFGLTKYASTKNESDLFNGFYVNAQAGLPSNLRLYAGLDAGPAVNIVVASVAITGGVVANIDFRLRDNNKDGKVRFDEITENAKSNPLNLFTTGGSLTAGLTARATVVGIPYDYQIANTTLLDYGNGAGLKTYSKQGNRLGQAILLGLISPAAALALGAGSALKLTSSTLKEVGKWSEEAWNTVEDGGEKAWKVLRAGGDNLFKVLGQFDGEALKTFKNITSKFTDGTSILVEDGLIKLAHGINSVSKLVYEFDVRNSARFVGRTFTSGLETIRYTFDAAGKLAEKLDFLPDGQQIKNLYNATGNYLRYTFDAAGKLAEKLDFLPDGGQVLSYFRNGSEYLRKTWKANGEYIEDAWNDTKYLGQKIYNAAGKLVGGFGDFFKGIGEIFS